MQNLRLVALNRGDSLEEVLQDRKKCSDCRVMARWWLSEDKDLPVAARHTARHSVIPRVVLVVEVADSTPIVNGLTGIALLRNIAMVIIRIYVETQSPLPQIIEASYFLRLLFGRGQRWQQQRRQNGDDGNDYQQFNQGESLTTLLRLAGMSSLVHLVRIQAVSNGFKGAHRGKPDSRSQATRCIPACWMLLTGFRRF